MLKIMLAQSTKAYRVGKKSEIFYGSGVGKKMWNFLSVRGGQKSEIFYGSEWAKKSEIFDASGVGKKSEISTFFSPFSKMK